MMRSLSSAVAGLRSHQTKMDVIGNNIANVNTFGFKSSRATFSDVYYQNMSGSKAGQAQTSGGKNPTQIGYGASVATIDMMMNVSGNTTTDRALDVHISGEGFLVTKDVSGRTFYSRLGNMGFDAAGNLVDGNGYLVQGFPMKQDPNNPEFMIPDVPSTGIADSASIQGIFCAPAIMERMTGIEISPTGTIIGLLAGDQTIAKQGSEDWIKDLNLPETSSYSGSVRWSVSALYTQKQMAQALGIADTDVKEVIMGDMALPSHYEDKSTTPPTPKAVQYSITKNGNQVEIRGLGPTPSVVLSGTLSNNQIIFKNGTTVAMTVKFDPLKDIKLSDFVINTRNSTTPVLTGATTKQLKTGENLARALAPNLDDKTLAANENYYELIDPTDNTSTWAANPENYKLKDWAAIITQGLTDNGFTATADLDPDNPAHAAYFDTVPVQATDPTTGTPLWVQEAIPQELDLYEQIRTTDMGGNTVIMGRTGGAPTENTYNPDNTVTGYPTKWAPPASTTTVLEYGDVSFTLGNNTNMNDPALIEAYMQTKGFNSVMANAKSEEEIAFTIGQIVLAKFQNQAGLSEAGTSMYTATNNSGEPILVVPGIEGTGNTQAGRLEMSNVDISKEFTDMITTQRGFQANSRIVTVSDEMLQELVNLKR